MKRGPAAWNAFPTLLEADGEGLGVPSTVRFLPGASNMEAVSGQVCVDDVYFSVLFVKPGLTGSSEEAAAVDAALMAVIG